MHNYLKKLDKEWDWEKYLPDIYDVFFAHDDWCNFLNRRGECNCNPDMTIKKREVLSEPERND